ncbi:hypothetical protein GCM10027425_27680 [Alteromonas gracilis]
MAEWSVDPGDHGWWVLPLDVAPGKAAASVRDVMLREVPKATGRPLSRRKAEEIAGEFQMMIAHARRTDARSARVLRPRPDGPIVALLTDHVHDAEGLDLQAFVEKHVGGASAGRRLETVELPAGTAVRVDERRQSPDMTMQSISHHLVLEEGRVLRQTLSWTIAQDGWLVRLADEVAASITIG